MSQSTYGVTLLTLGTSIEGRPLYAIAMGGGDTTDTPTPTLWLQAGQHPREWISVGLGMRLVRDLARAWRSRSAAWMERIQVIIVPMLNPGW